MVEAKRAVKELLERTMDSALVQRLERGRVEEQRVDRRNGYYERSLLTSMGYIEAIRVPRGRVTSIADVVLPKYKRSQPEFDAAVMNSFLLGHSTRKSKRFFNEFLGELGVSHTYVSRILSRLDERCAAWRRRKLNKPYAFLWLDAKYAKIYNALQRPHAVLFAYGATAQGSRELLGFQIHSSEAIVHWECMLNDLVQRGLDVQKLELVTSDENSGCRSAVTTVLGDVAQQACAVHLERNMGKLVSKAHRSEFQQAVSQIFKQSSLSEARKQLKTVISSWKVLEPAACVHLQACVHRSLVFYRVACGRWRTHLKSTNLLERFFRELKRFEKARQFRFADARSCERFYYAIAYDYNERHTRMPHLR